MEKVTFGSIRSYEDLGLFLNDLSTTSPEPKRMQGDVTGMDGDLELTYALTKDVKFRNRTIKFTFIKADYTKDWMALYTQVLNKLHGRKFHVVVSSDPDWYWDCFVTVDKLKSDENKGTIVVKCDAYPYKQKDVSKSVTATAGGVSVTCPVTRQSVVPEITSSASIAITYGGETFSFDSGTHKDPGLVLEEGTNTLTVTGSGTVTIAYKDGSL